MDEKKIYYVVIAHEVEPLDELDTVELVGIYSSMESAKSAVSKKMDRMKEMWMNYPNICPEDITVWGEGRMDSAFGHFGEITIHHGSIDE